MLFFWPHFLHSELTIVIVSAGYLPGEVTHSVPLTNSHLHLLMPEVMPEVLVANQLIKVL